MPALRDFLFIMFAATLHIWGRAMVQFVETLRYKPEGRGFDSR